MAYTNHMYLKKKDSVENYFNRFDFPGGIKLYDLHHLNGLTPLRTVGGQRKGNIRGTDHEKIAYESKREKREIYRILNILEAKTIKTQVVELITPSGKRFYPDVLAQLQDGTVLMLEIKHILDFLSIDVIEKYQTMIAYCKKMQYGCAMLDGNYRDFRYVAKGSILHFPQVIDWLEWNLEKKGEFTMKDLRLKFKDEKYIPTLVSYALMNGYRTDVTFRDPSWAIRIKHKSTNMLK